MKTTYLLSAVLAGAVCLPVSLAAAAKDEGKNRQPRETASNFDRSSETLAKMQEQLFRSRLSEKILGTEVKNTKGETLGKIEDMILDLQRGDVAYVIVSTGGFLGIGDKLVAVPARKFELARNPERLILNVDKKTFEGSPNFDRTAWPKLDDDAWHKIVNRYHAEVPEKSKETFPERYREISQEERLGFMKVSDIRGKPVLSMTGDKLGELWDLMVDLQGGRIVFAIIDEENRDETANVPPETFTAGPNDEALYLRSTKDTLTAAPKWDRTKSPDPTALYVVEVYEFYGQPGYWMRQPDNTRRNVRDAGGETLTPFDQGTSESDRKITQQIRKWIVVEPGKDRFSTAAHNIKIITRDGKVTLRGVVKNAAEKKAIEEYAKSVPGVLSVDDQLEVKAE